MAKKKSQPVQPKDARNTRKTVDAKAPATAKAAAKPVPKRGSGGQPSKSTRTPGRLKVKEVRLERVAARFVDADTSGPIAEHIVEWFDGKNRIAVTRTDASGLVALPATKTGTALEARILRPHADPTLAPVLVATKKTAAKPGEGGGVLVLEVKPENFARIREAGEPKDRAQKRARIIDALGLTGDALKRRIGNANLEESLPGHRAARAAMINIGMQLHEYEGKELPPGLRELLESFKNRQKCTCEACESALSPLAYLAHLLDYTMRHVVRASPPKPAVTMAELEAHFGQKFSALTQSCKAGETELAQALIAIEVLENHFAQFPLTVPQRTALDKERAARLLDAYLVLLQRMGVPFDDLRLADTAAKKAEVAGLLGVEPSRVDALLLDPLLTPPSPNALSADRLAKLFGLVSGQGSSAPATPEILTWRYEALSKSWEDEDQPATNELSGVPVVDPDVIGPDDFRNPAAKANAAAPDGPFDIWLRRRAFVDTAQATLGGLADATAMVARMYQSFPYQGQSITAWLNATPVTAFGAIEDALIAGAQVDANTARLEADLKISPAAFRRLMALKLKDELARAMPSRGERLSAEERNELLTILGGSLKRRAFARWIQEETTASIAVDPKHFWAPRRPPTAGAWPRLHPSGEPLLDPASVSAGDLPEGSFGATARTLLDNRTQDLSNRRAVLAAAREQQGLAQCLAVGLAWWTVPAGSSVIAQIRALSQSLAAPATAAATRARIETKLFMTVEDFSQIVQVDQREQAGERLAAGDYEAVYQILTGAYRRQQFPAWVAQETEPYWRLLKLKLVPWRASADDRGRWQSALRAASQPVVVDPDLLYASDFILNARAYALWLARRTEVETHLTSLRTQTAAARATTPTAVERTALDGLLLAELQISAQGLLDLEAAADAGQDAVWRLAQLLLDGEALAELCRIVRLAATAAGTKRLLEREWEAAFSICIQAWKRRARTTTWRGEERTRSTTVRPVVLSPDFFKILPPPLDVFPPPSLPPLPAWRASTFARIDWVDRLQSRIDLKASMLDAWRTSLRGAEEIVLPKIRDVLLAANHAARPVVEVAKALEYDYLIDFRMGGCATATRVSQAIETIQALLEGLRTRQSPLVEKFDIATTAANGNTAAYDFAAFDEDMQWLGSYGAWRSAMFIQLFPENLLSPSLRDHRTHGFQQLLKSLRATPKLTPDDACRYAGEYADYFNDVTGLTLAACVRANIRNKEPSCIGRRLAPTKLVEFLIALAPSGKVYFAPRDTLAASDLSYAQSSWAPIEKLSGVTAVLGATAYEPQSAGADNKRVIAVLLKLAGSEGPKLGILSFDLDTAEWSDVKELALPTGFVDFDASFITASASPSTSERPVVEVVPLPSGNGQTSSLNVSLTDWDGQAFRPRTFGVELHYVSDTDLNWGVAGGMAYCNAENINSATDWAKKQNRGFRAAIPTFRTDVNGNRELIVFDSKFVEEYDFGAPGGRVPWGGLQWYARNGSVTEQLVAEDDQTSTWLQVTTTAARAIEGPGYVAAFPKFRTDLPLRTTLPDADMLPFHIYAFKPSDSVSTDRVPHKELVDGELFNPGSGESPLAGFHRAVHEYALTKGKAAGIPTWWVFQGAEPTIGDDIFPWNPDDPETDHEAVFFAKGDGFRRRTSSCANLANWKAFYPGGQPKFAYYHKPTAKDVSAWRSLIRNIYTANNGQTPENLNYLDEASYFVPVIVAMRLHQAGEYDSSLEWFRLAVDWALGTEQAIDFSPFLFRHSKVTAAFNVTDDWLRDPLHPHLIAATRPRAYARFTYFSIIRCLLDYADAEYTGENVAKAKRLYKQALDLLRARIFQIVDACAPKQTGPELDPGVIGKIDDKFKREIQNVFDEITPLEDAIRNRFKKKVEDLIDRAGLGPGLPKLWQEIEAERDKLPPPVTLGGVLTANKTYLRDLATAIPLHDDFRAQLDLAVDAALIRRDVTLGSMGQGTPGAGGYPPYGVPRSGGGGAPPGTASASYAATASYKGKIADEAAELSDIYGVGAGYGLLSGALNPFCIPVNPLMRALRLHAEVNIYKIENCRNIAGMKRTLDLYGAPTDTTTGMPSIGAGGQLVTPGLVRLAPTQYRFRFLIERARQLAQLAQQIESALLSSLIQKDAAAYSMFKARQDLRLARSELTLQDLRLKQSEDEFTLAGIQQERALFQVSHFSILLDSDLNAHEIVHLVLSGIALAHSIAVGIGYSYKASLPFGGDPILAVQAFGQAWAQKAGIAATLAQYERRREEWRFQRSLAQFDVSASNQQQVIAQDRVQIATQERAVTELKTTLAEDTVEFLNNKQFLTEERAAWMAEIFEGLLRTRLQQTTSVARLASSQLAFERQEETPALIQPDYWTVKDDLASGLGEAPDRKGLTGSARLLNDIELLAQHALDTDKRKLHLTKTISLAQLAPLEFAQFRSTGVLTVATPMSLFDQDFPGQYLRLIKRVRVSIAALIPATVGIKATLTASATSRVVVGGDIFQTIRVQHGPDLVALTSTQNATGVFDFDVQSEMLAPFEGIGVDTIWEFKLPKAANQFNYDTIADVLVTLDYTALFSYDYRETVIAGMRPTLDAERGFSFRHDFADAWYDLINPALSPIPMTVRFRTTYDDFPANLDRLAIRNVALGFLRKDGTSFEVAIAGLTFTPDGEETGYGGAAETVEGIASTRRGNAQSWNEIVGKTPCGTWELALPNTAIIRNRFSTEQIENIVLAVSFSGGRPAWP